MSHKNRPPEARPGAPGWPPPVPPGPSGRPLPRPPRPAVFNFGTALPWISTATDKTSRSTNPSFGLSIRFCDGPTRFGRVRLSPESAKTPLTSSGFRLGRDQTATRRPLQRGSRPENRATSTRKRHFRQNGSSAGPRLAGLAGPNGPSGGAWARLLRQSWQEQKRPLLVLPRLPQKPGRSSSGRPVEAGKTGKTRSGGRAVLPEVPFPRWRRSLVGLDPR